jgi:hypothetical protein
MKPSMEREFSKLVKPKARQVCQFTEANFANLTDEGGGDAFRFGNQGTALYHKLHEVDTLEQSHTKATPTNKSCESNEIARRRCLEPNIVA